MTSASTRRSSAYWRRVSSWRYRVPSGVSTATTSDRAMRRSRPSRASYSSRSATRATASSSAPPANTARRSNSQRSWSSSLPVRPLHRGQQRAMPFDPTPPTPQQSEPVIEAGRDLRRCHRAASRRGELDGQRDPIQPDAELLDRGQRRIVQHEVGPGLHRPSHEEARGVTGGQRRQRHHVLTPETQRLAARRQHPCLAAARPYGPHQVASRVHHVLAVVEHHQGPERREVIDDRLRG